ncbi:hypothetical protein H9639_08415 [Arthrobacter sp. Sa2CUA1]|uniref:Uncharacterized protein n=1 Tax=Arthrobacter gallicola TaxID=2762225 RepID=A0ABR8UST1_9MICC|nr:hypothetical protein [Arthrobacter gallicola]MBD7995316.1 hypothetical protein [Arthrobacter gallicola]
MLELLLAAAGTAAAGFIVWGADRRRRRYGILLLPGISLAAGLLAWIILQFSGVSTSLEYAWLTWALPVILGPAAAVAAALLIVPPRSARDNAELERILKL